MIPLFLAMLLAAPQTQFPLIQLGTQPKTDTPIMGCAAGQTLWRFDEIDAHVNTDKGFVHKKVMKPHVSREQTLLGDIHQRKQHVCTLNGVVPEIK